MAEAALEAAEWLHVAYRTPLDSELRASMTTHLIKYLLFMRGQIPCLYGDLQRHVVEAQQVREQEDGSRRRRRPMTGLAKKALDCVSTADRLFDTQLNAIFSLRVKRVALVFGSSLLSPREAVIVDFDSEVESKEEEAGSFSQQLSTADSPATDEENASAEEMERQPPSPATSREKLMHLCAQKLTRALLTLSVESFSSALPATQLHIAVLAERQIEPIRGFLPKQRFKLRLPRERSETRTCFVRICSPKAPTNGSKKPQDTPTVINSSTKPPAEAPVRKDQASATNVGSSTRNDADLLWYVLEKPIAGFSGTISIHPGE